MENPSSFPLQYFAFNLTANLIFYKGRKPNLLFINLSDFNLDQYLFIKKLKSNSLIWVLPL